MLSYFARQARENPHLAARWAALAFLLTAGVGLLLAHEGHAPLPTRGAEIDLARGLVTLSKEARDALDLRTAEAESRPVTGSFTAYAAIAAPWGRHAFASSRLGGRVARLHARPGQAVEAGEVLAEVESLELETLQQDILAADNEARLAAKVVAVLEGAGGAVAAQDLLEARSRHRQHLAALEVGKAKWAALGLPADGLAALLKGGKPSALVLPVLSPVAGTVLHADLAVGRVVEPAEHLFEVADVSRVWVRVDVLERDLHLARAGQEVELRLPALPGEAFRARLGVVGLHLDPVTHANAAWAELENAPGREPRLLPGMTGVARVLLPGAAKALAVPEEALVEDGSESYVLIEEAAVAGGSQFQRRNVVAGRRAGGWAEVLSAGLFPGDRVVTRGAHQVGSFFIPGVLRPSPEAARSMGLRVEPASARPVADVLDIDGSVELPPQARAAASARMGGTLVAVHARLGQRVKAGDVLAEVAGQEALSLQLDLLRAHLEGQLLEETFRRLKDMGDGVPRRRIIEAESRVVAGRQSRATLRRKLLLAGLDEAAIGRLLEKKDAVPAIPVRAPVAGIVVSFDGVLGQAVKAEGPLFTVHDLSRPLFAGHLSEAESGRVRVGQRVRVRLSADPAFVADGKVARTGRTFGAESRTLAAWVELDAPPARPLRDGQLARLTAVLDEGTARPALAVPLAAVVREGARAFVFVRKGGGSFDRREVGLGRADDLLAEVVSGLAEGEPVAVEGAARLQSAFAVIR